MTESNFKGVGGLNIYFRSWYPSETARAVVAIVPGFNSHSGYYEWVATQLTAKGVVVYAIDLRGRGKSDGERFYVQNFEDYVTDVASFVSIVKEKEKGLPVLMLGHSAGGVVACNYALDYQQELAGLICESFAYQVPAPDFALAVLKGLSHIAPHAHVLKLHNEDFSRDTAVVDFMNNDPLIAHETQPTQTVAAMVRADERLKKEFQKITLPLLILHGTKDKATKPSGSQHFFETAGSNDKTLKLYEGSFHDPLNDLDRGLVMADILSWVNERISKA
jgi:acylglycerol lipase